jgi:hypothetical protein
MKVAELLIVLFVFFKQTKESLILKTLSGDKVLISKENIYFNQKLVAKNVEGIIYASKYNRIIEQNGSVLLFLEIDNTPNFNEIEAFKITSQKAIKLAECVYNDNKQGIGPAPFTDMDNDGKLEFGGFDLTEYYESKDSMYYNPSQYYEINSGTVIFDSALTKKMDNKINGVYLKKPLDKDGNCCIVIKKPKLRKSK